MNLSSYKFLSGKKVGLIGNMNNNYFSLMRYFRDLGVDAHLLVYSNEIEGGLAHFSPWSDSWDYDSWKRYVRILPFPNDVCSVIGKPKKLIPPPSKKKLLKAFVGFDYYIGTGITPALFNRCGLRLDIFSPYETGIEYLASTDCMNLLRSAPLLRKIRVKKIRGDQAKGVIASKAVLTGELSQTKDILDDLGKQFYILPMPMVYCEKIVGRTFENKFGDILKKIKSHKFTVFHHARVMWKKPATYTDREWCLCSKRTNYLLEGFADFIKISGSKSALLIMCSYGPDIEEAKFLVKDLGIEDNVVWLPKLMRKEILAFLSLVDVGCGEFMTVPKLFWGGTAWEVMAAGKPLLQSFNFSNQEFFENFGYPPPPILDVRSSQDVSKHLYNLASNKETSDELGEKMKAWFLEYNGRNLAKKWLGVLAECVSSD